MYLKTSKEIAHMRESAEILNKAHGEMAKMIAPGVTTLALDECAEKYIRAAGGQPAFKGYTGFPATICASINHEILHGIPSERALKEGDILSIDCGVLYNGFYSDAAYTYAVGNVPKEWLNLLAITEKALYSGIAAAKVGNRIGDISYAVYQCVEPTGYSIVRNYGGHGIGKNLHEGPDVPNIGCPGRGYRIQEGLVIAIEPLVNLGGDEVVEGSDGCVTTKDKKVAAHFEHTVAIVNGKPEVLTTFQYIKENIR